MFASEVGDAFEGISTDQHFGSFGFSVDLDFRLGQLGLRMTWRSEKEVGKQDKEIDRMYAIQRCWVGHLSFF